MYMFYTYLALLVFLPLPFGANVPPGWAAAVVWINGLAAVWLLLWALRRTEVTPAFRKAWPILVLFMLWLCWIAFQLVPLPIGVVEVLSPKAAELQIQASQILTGHMPDSATISLDTHATTSGLIKSVSYVTLFCLTLLLVGSRRRLRMLAWTLVISGTFQAVYGGLMTLSGIEQIFWYEKQAFRGLVTGTFIARAHLAAYLVICLSVGVGLMLALLDRRHGDNWKAWLRGWMKVFLGDKFRLRLFLVIMVVGLVMTQSRMGNASFLMSLLVVGVLGMVFLRHARRGLGVLVISVLLIDVVIVGAWFGIDKVMDRLEKTVVQTTGQGATHRDGSLASILQTDIRLGENYAALLEQRGLVRQDMENYLSDYWLTGSGLGTFRHVYPQYRGPGISAYFSHAHIDYYQFFAETGAPGVILPGSAILLSLLAAFMATVRRRDRLAGGMAFAVVMSILALLLHITVDFPLQIPAYAMTFMVILALAFVVKTLPARRRQ